MLEKFEIQKLRDLPIEGVAERLGLRVKHHKSLCPFHDDSHPSLMFNNRKNTFRCYVCGAHGSTIDLAIKLLPLQGKSGGGAFFEACRWLAGESNVVLDTCKSTDKYHNTYSSNPVPQVDVRHLSQLISRPYLCDEARRFLFDERKISEQVVRELGVTSISSPVPMSGDLHGSWFNAPSLLIPYRDVNGNLISVQARFLGGEGTVSGSSSSVVSSSASTASLWSSSSSSTASLGLNVSSSTTFTFPRFQFPKGSRCTIFNLPVLKTLVPGDELWITEGVTDCLAMLSSGRKAIAIPSATLLKAEDVRLLTSFVSPACPEYVEGLTFHIAPDQDAPGERLYLDLRELLGKTSTLIRHQLPYGYKDFGEYWKCNHVTMLPC